MEPVCLLPRSVLGLLENRACVKQIRSEFQSRGCLYLHGLDGQASPAISVLGSSLTSFEKLCFVKFIKLLTLVYTH